MESVSETCVDDKLMMVAILRGGGGGVPTSWVCVCLHTLIRPSPGAAGMDDVESERDGITESTPVLCGEHTHHMAALE